MHISHTPTKRSQLACLSVAVLLLQLFAAADADALARGRRMARRTAVVVGSAAAHNQQAQQQADASAKEAEAAKQEAAKEEPQSDAAQKKAQTATAPAGASPIGHVVHTLPAGCTPKTVGGAEYQHCGNDYYKAAFQGTELVYVTTQP